jgi:hypothetical protein
MKNLFIQKIGPRSEVIAVTSRSCSAFGTGLREEFGIIWRSMLEEA